MRGYLVVVHDTHSDDSYEFHWKMEDAIKAAQKHVTEFALHYRIEELKLDSYDCSGLRDWHFLKGSPCGSFRVNVRELEIPTQFALL